MRPNNRQRSRGGRSGGGSGGGSGGHNQHKQHHNHNPNRPPNRNQIFDSSGPDVRVRGNAHQVFDKYQALAREAAASGDRIAAEAYWQYADHYFRVIQTMGGFVPRGGNQGWGDGAAEDGQQQGNAQQGQPQQANGGGDFSGYDRDESQQYRQPGDPQQQRQPGDRQPGDRQQGERQQGDRQQGDRQQGDRQQGDRQQSERQQNDRQHGERQGDRQQGETQQNRQQVESPPQRQQGEPPQRRPRNEDLVESEPGLGGVAFLQTGRSMPVTQDPADDEQPEIPEFVPAGAGRRR